MTREVAVAMTTRNRAYMLPENIEAVLKQTFDNFSFYIIDDNSNDDTYKLLSDYQKYDSRIKIFRNNKTKGSTYNYIALMDMVEEKYVTHLDDDDIIYPDKLKLQYEFLKNNPQYALVGSFIDIFSDGTQDYIDNWVYESEYDILKLVMLFFNPFCHSAMMFNNELLTQNNIKYEIINTYAADYGICLRINQHNLKFANIPQKLVRYRRQMQSISVNKDSWIIQTECSKRTRKEMLMLAGYCENEAEEIVNKTQKFPHFYFEINEIIKISEQICKKALENQYCTTTATQYWLNLLKTFQESECIKFFDVYKSIQKLK